MSTTPAPRTRRRDHLRRTGALLAASATAAAGLGLLPATAAGPGNPHPASNATTPIKHVVVIIGENHSFDNVFATYTPQHGETVRNLLSEGVVTATGALGSNAAAAQQQQATDQQPQPYTLTPPTTGPYAALPQPDTTYVPTSCSGQPNNAPDGRFPSNLPNGPYQITSYVPYLDNHSTYGGTCDFQGAYVGDPIHRFYQMWQQVNGGSNALHTWVANTAGLDNGASPPAAIHQGGLQMGYYNVATGDAPAFRFLADHYAMSDNYHQSVMGGTGANHIALGDGDAAFYQDSGGHPTTPPSNQIENPDPKPGTNNNYTQDGYQGGSYSNCADHSQPGVGAIFSYLGGQPRPAFNSGDCAPGAYYLLNNYNPGYDVNGNPNPLGPTHYTVPPQSFPTIADELSAAGVSWGYFGEGYNHGNPTGAYCGICDPFQYATSVMTDPAKRANTQHDSSDFDAAVAGGTLPAVSFLKPGDDDGHPGYSTLAAYENFVSRTVTEIQNQPNLWKDTAILTTFDETGGYYDSGYVQPITFFGDGPRVPMLVVSPYTKPGHVDHTYTDHASILKFIEANWRLAPLSARSFDNLPNPSHSGDGGYVPGNGPAIGDLMTLFDFGHPQAEVQRPRGATR